jgi:hypothetical protein
VGVREEDGMLCLCGACFIVQASITAAAARRGMTVETGERGVLACCGCMARSAGGTIRHGRMMLSLSRAVQLI